MRGGERRVAATETPGMIPTRPPREVPLPLWRLALVMLPLSLFASAVLTAMDLFSTDERNGWKAVGLFLAVALMSSSIDAALTGSVAGKGKRNPLRLRATGSVAAVLLVPVIVAVVLSLDVDAPRRPLALIGALCILSPLAFAFAGPWLARQVLPGGPTTGGSVWGRFWRIALLGPLPLPAVVALSVPLRGGDVPLISGYWTGAVIDTALSTVSNLCFVIYAWAITRTARTNTAEVFA